MCSNVWTSLALPPSFQRSFWTPSCFSPVSSKARPTGTQRRHSCAPLFNALCNRQTFWERARIKKTCLKRFCWGRFLSCSLLHHPPPPSRTPVRRLTPWNIKSNFQSRDLFTARQQDPAEPCAWQPADLRSPSIVCLIDYFPCNYSPCHTQYFTAPGKVQEGLPVLKDSIHIVTFEPLMWRVRKHMLNWRPVLPISDAWH